MSSDGNPELESFRQQWQEEVLRRREAQPRKPGRTRLKHTRADSNEISLAFHLGAPSGSDIHVQDDGGNYGTYDFDNMEASEESRKLRSSSKEVQPESIPNRHPISALDHYEMAVVRETEGKLGESLDLYRKAFRLDDCVDQTYKKKHFPAASIKPKSSDIVSSLPMVQVKKKSKTSSTVSALVASFANAAILGALPIISGDIPPPCPMKSLPGELLVNVLDHVANIDMGTLSQLARVSKRFAYLVTTEDSIWKHLIHGPRFGLGGMHYNYAKEISGASLELSLANLSISQFTPAPRTLPITLSLNAKYPTYRHMFQHRPRVRFSGVYISTVNYTRPGASGPNTLTWNTPIHVVTYYRYLRFYRDGSCISLLTTAEPLDVVPYLQKENVGGDFIATTTMPVGVMRDARRGRWKLAPPQELLEHETNKHRAQTLMADDLAAETLVSATATKEPSTPSGLHLQPEAAIDNTTAASHNLKPKDKEQEQEPDKKAGEHEGMLRIETEGPTPAYQYTARFELQSSSSSSSSSSGKSAGAGSGLQNTKLVWRGFWSYNLLSGDWAEFGLRNDRAFVWSRVRSWGSA